MRRVPERMRVLVDEQTRGRIVGLRLRACVAKLNDNDGHKLT